MEAAIAFERFRRMGRYFICIYGVVLTSSVSGGGVAFLHSVFPWWRWVSLLDVKGEDPSNCFRDNMMKKVGFGLLTKFWRDPWVGIFPLELGSL